MYEGQRSEKSSISPSYKSWGEEQIARLLQREKIRYQYEYPTAVVDGGKLRIYYPDFTLPDYGMIIEYFGVNGESDYDQRARHKMDVYKQAGIEGLFLTRDSLKGDWPTKIIGGIEAAIKDRARKFYSRQSADSDAYGRCS